MSEHRDPEASPVFRYMLQAVAIAAVIALAFVGPDVEEHNLNVLREYVNAR